ncbi:hypothetical protein TNCV_4295261 [Trichonephila clavipes]|uniref:Uncharacterized protein n=1 Tax=Trichonephila clavipes TaxID=2585209 RepID=A0A8X6UVM8_TRICX|nr:hypothetical protein TNCV_4295261 [Trichonephila clavipes]
MSFVIGPPAQELQLLHTVPSIFDGDLISFLDDFERELVPMDLTMPILNPCVKKSIGFKAIQPMDLSVNILSRGSFPVSPSLGGVSASKYGILPFGSHALHATGGRVHDLVDVVGRLGNASRREPTLACSVSPTMETGFGNTCGTLASERFGPWDAL